MWDLYGNHAFLRMLRSNGTHLGPTWFAYEVAHNGPIWGPGIEHAFRPKWDPCLSHIGSYGLALVIPTWDPRHNYVCMSMWCPSWAHAYPIWAQMGGPRGNHVENAAKLIWGPYSWPRWSPYDGKWVAHVVTIWYPCAHVCWVCFQWVVQVL